MVPTHVVIEPDDDPFWQCMRKLWADQKARGQVPRTKELVDAEINALRDEAEEEMRQVERIHEHFPRANEGSLPDARGSS